MKILPTPQPLKAADLFREPYRDCELWDGVAIVRDPSGGPAEAVAARIVYHLSDVVYRGGLGWITLSSQGFLLARNPDRVLAADGAFTSKARLASLPRRGFIPCAPDFALEVRSPRDTWLAVLQKAATWIAHGTSVVWAVDPPTRRVVVLRPCADPLELGPGDVADASPAIVGFSLPVAQMFAGLDG